MKNYVNILLSLVVGGFVGASVVWIDAYLPQPAQQTNIVSLSKLLELSHVHIAQDHYFCESADDRTVGAVVGSIFEWNLDNIRNRVNLSCSQGRCELSISQCGPWQNSECGSRILSFEVTPNKDIAAGTFQCLDIP
ncbi:MAG: hypothetical protein V4812_17995 [Pseudomonadota bacterium]